MTEKIYTIGEIFRGKMLKNFRGKPYGDKSQVAKAVRALRYRIIETPWGPSKALPISEIQRHNAKFANAHVAPANKNRSPHPKIRGKRRVRKNAHRRVSRAAVPSDQ